MEELVRKSIHGDQEAFVQLMQDHMQSMYKTAWVYLKRDEDVADAIQETILNCYEKLHTLKHPKYFKTWMIRILVNECNNILRNRRDYLDIQDMQEQGRMEQAYDRSEWQCLLEMLDEKYGIVLLMHYCEEMSVREIAQSLGIRQNTVLTRLRRGRQQLRRELGIEDQIMASERRG